MLLRLIEVLAPLCFLGSSGSCDNGRHLSCEAAEQDCIGRLACGMAFHGHRLDCKAELAGRTPGRCSVACKQSLVSLASTEEGYAYLGCDCGEDDYCQALRLRTGSCWWKRPCAAPSNATGTAVSGSPRPACSRVAADCVEDPVCAVAWDYYRRLCHEVLDGSSQCSTRCRNSVKILVRMERAHRLLDCVCDFRVTRTSCANELNRVRTLCFAMGDINPDGNAAAVGLVAGGELVVLALLFSYLHLRPLHA